MLDNNVRRDWSTHSCTPHLFNQETARDHLAFLNARRETLEFEHNASQIALKQTTKEYAKLAKTIAQHPNNKMNISKLESEIKELKSNIADKKNRIEELKEAIASLELDLQIDTDLDKYGYFGRSMFGKCISCIVQTVAIPITAAIALTTKYPFTVASVVLGLQAYGAIASVTSSSKLSSNARFKTVRESCEATDAGIDCVDSMVRLTQSINPEQAGNATEYLGLHHRQFSHIYEKELNKLDIVQEQLDKFKPGPLPPNRCESAQYVALTKCVTPIKTPKLGSADSNCNLYNHCNETVKLQFGESVVTLESEGETSCFKTGIFYEDAFYSKEGAPNEIVARASVKTSYSSLACNLKGKYSREETVVSKLINKEVPSPTFKNRALITELNQACNLLSPLECAVYLSNKLHEMPNDVDLQSYITMNYPKLFQAINAQIALLENAQEDLEDEYGPFSYEASLSYCDESQTAFSIDCVEAMVRCSHSKKTQAANNANDYIKQHQNQFIAGLEASLAKLHLAREKIAACDPQKKLPNKCEIKTDNPDVFVSVTECAKASAKVIGNNASERYECTYENTCDEAVDISFGTAKKTLLPKEVTACFEMGAQRQNGKIPAYVGIQCTTEGSLPENIAEVSRIAFPVDVTAELTKLTQHCKKTTPLKCVESTVDLIDRSQAHPNVCQAAQQNSRELDRAIDRQERNLNKFKTENALLFFPPKPLDPCESIKERMPLEDCLKPILDCDLFGDNTCKYKNICPEDLILSFDWQSYRLNSGKKTDCFEDGTYTEIESFGKKKEYKNFAAAVCFRSISEIIKNPQLHKVSVSKARIN